MEGSSFSPKRRLYSFQAYTLGNSSASYTILEEQHPVAKCFEYGRMSEDKTSQFGHLVAIWGNYNATIPWFDSASEDWRDLLCAPETNQSWASHIIQSRCLVYLSPLSSLTSSEKVIFLWCYLLAPRHSHKRVLRFVTIALTLQSKRGGSANLRYYW